MMKRAVFLDRDGVINEDLGYVYRPEDFHLLPGVPQALRLLQEAGFQLVIITNQSGIARGYYTEEDFKKLCGYMDGLLAEQGVKKIPVYHCPHLEGNCECRKPKTGLFYRAARELGICFRGSWAIGDKERDLSICEKEPVRGILISNGAQSKQIDRASLPDATKCILRSGRSAGKTDGYGLFSTIFTFEGE